jgi:hypothetical protein
LWNWILSPSYIRFQLEKVQVCGQGAGLGLPKYATFDVTRSNLAYINGCELYGIGVWGATIRNLGVFVDLAKTNAKVEAFSCALCYPKIGAFTDIYAGMSLLPLIAQRNGRLFFLNWPTELRDFCFYFLTKRSEEYTFLLAYEKTGAYMAVIEVSPGS